MLESPSSITANLPFRVRSPAEEVLQDTWSFLLCTSTTSSPLDTSIPMLWKFHNVQFLTIVAASHREMEQILRPLCTKKEICLMCSITSSCCMTDSNLRHQFTLWLAGIFSPVHVVGRAPHLQRIAQSYFRLTLFIMKAEGLLFMCIPFVEMASGGSSSVSILGQQTHISIGN